MEKPESGHSQFRKKIAGVFGSLAGKDYTLPFPDDFGDPGALEPGDEVMPCANNIRTLNDECFNGPTQDMTF